MSSEPKPVTSLTDEELLDELRHEVNKSRNGTGHNRKRTRAVAQEAARRGWNLRKPSTP